LPTIVRGDWVLFHPVYSPEELKAVEVLRSPTYSISLRFVLNAKSPGPPKGSENNIRQDCIQPGQASEVRKHPYSLYERAHHISRWGFDVVSGYKHKPIPADSRMSLEELKKGGYILDEKAWLRVSVFIKCYFRRFITVVQRILFLETIAGVPGMVAAMLRHLMSLRLMVSQTSFLTITFSIT